MYKMTHTVQETEIPLVLVFLWVLANHAHLEGPGKEERTEV